MSVQFAEKRLNLLANTRSSITWNNPDFSIALGQDSGIIKTKISIGFQIQNNTNNACYIAVSYQTIKTDYQIKGNNAIAVVPANSSLYINYASVPELASLEPYITAITASFLSASPGNVVVNLLVDTPQTVSGGGSSMLIGPNVANAVDYVPIYFGGVFQEFGGTPTSNSQYFVPAGKKAYLEAIAVHLPSFDFGKSIITMTILHTRPFVATYTLLQFVSDIYPIVFSLSTRFYSLIANDILTIQFTNAHPDTTIKNPPANISISINEVLA